MRGLTITCVAGDVALSSVQDPVTGETRGDVMHLWLRVGANPLDVAAQVLVREPGGRLGLEEARGRHLTFALTVQPGGVALPGSTLPAPAAEPDRCITRAREAEERAERAEQSLGAVMVDRFHDEAIKTASETASLPADPMAFVAVAAAATFRDTGAHATGVILGWRLYLALEQASRPARRLFRMDIAEEESMETLLGMRIVVDPESADRCTPVLGAMRTALQLARLEAK